MDDKYKELS